MARIRSAPRLARQSNSTSCSFQRLYRRCGANGGAATRTVISDALRSRAALSSILHNPPLDDRTTGSTVSSLPRRIAISFPVCSILVRIFILWRRYDRGQCFRPERFVPWALPFSQSSSAMAAPSPDCPDDRVRRSPMAAPLRAIMIYPRVI
jgi:hypothetical protein